MKQSWNSYLVAALLAWLVVADAGICLAAPADLPTVGQPPEPATDEPVVVPFAGLKFSPEETAQLEAVLKKRYPTTLEDLRTLEHRVRTLPGKLTPSVVNIQMGPSQGSGVIISEDGYVLTAGHVIGKPNQDLTMILSDGRKVKGKSLGVNNGIDSGLVKITDTGPWPFSPMASSETLKPGQWVVSIGHPGGLVEGRQAVVRLGRILFANDQVICTDCTLVGGDSGGPLFDLEGRVIGIHSRIGVQLTTNFHVPIATYHDTWNRLVAAELWGGSKSSDANGNRPLVGITGDPEARKALIRQVFPGSPAEKAGVKSGDIVEKLDSQKIDNFEQLAKLIGAKKPSEKVKLSILRGSESLEIEVTLGGIPGPLPGGLPEEKKSEKKG